VRTPIVTCVVAGLVTLSAFAGQSGRQSVPTPGIPATGFAALDQYRASRIAMFSDDFGQLGRYRGDNAALRAPAAGEKRVVFFGDSLTDGWRLNESFPGKPYINRSARRKRFSRSTRG